MRAIHWGISGPVIVAIVTGVVALAGTAYTGHINNDLERHKFEYNMIQTALSASNRSEKAQQIKFLLDIGLLDGLNHDKVEEYSKDDGKILPHAAGIRDNRISYARAKLILNKIKDKENNSYYNGNFSNDDDFSLYIALSRFQKDKHLTVDGLLGAGTIEEFWEDCLDCQNILQSDLSKDNAGK